MNTLINCVGMAGLISIIVWINIMMENYVDRQKAKNFNPDEWDDV